MIYMAFTLIFAGLVTLYRNEWVFKERVRVIVENWKHSDYQDRWDSYWDYHKMMCHFWIWDIEQMKYEEPENDNS